MIPINIDLYLIREEETMSWPLVVLGGIGAALVGWSMIGASLQSRLYAKKYDYLLLITGAILMSLPFIFPK